MPALLNFGNDGDGDVGGSVAAQIEAHGGVKALHPGENLGFGAG